MNPSSPAPAAANLSQTPEDVLKGLRGMDARVTDIAYRLARSGVDLCQDRVSLIGFVPHDLAQYDDDFRDAAIRAFALTGRPSVLTVAEDSPAARAGLRPDDILVSVDGWAFPAEPLQSASGSYASVEQAIGVLEAGFADGVAELEIGREGRTHKLTVEAEQGCASRFQVMPSGSLGASADGRYVQVTSALVSFATGEADLAAVLAHEFAHNILRHRQRLDEAGVKRGLLKYFGRNARLIRASEVEADRLSVYLLDRAGYPPEAAARVWGRLGPRSSGWLGSAATHPNWKDRVASLRAEAELLTRLKEKDAKPLPPFMTGERP